MDPFVYYLLPFLLAILASVWYLFIRDIKVSNLHSKCVFITGCDTGFGHRLATTLDKLGLHVFVGCLTEQGEQQLQAKCSDRLHTVLMDVTSLQDIKKCLDEVENFLKIHKNMALLAIVNNAGIDIPGFFDWSSMVNIKKVFNVNVWGVLEVTKAFLPLLKKHKGRIINVASAAGKVAVPGAGAYSASKFVIQCYSDVLRQELKPFGVTVHIIDPGFFKTNMTDMSKKKSILNQLYHNLDKEKKEEYGEAFLEKALEGPDNLEFFCQDCTPVIQAMEHAITSSCARLRYIVGWDHRLIWRWIAMLPSGVLDMLFLPLIPSVKATQE